MPSRGNHGRWDDAEDEILIEFAREKWYVEPQRGPVWALWTHSTRTAKAAEDHWRHVLKTPQGVAAAVAGKAAAKARLEGRDLKMEELVSQGFSWAEMEARIQPQDGKSVTAGALQSYWPKSVVCTLSASCAAAGIDLPPAHSIDA
jgi:hypothetical protein